MWRNGYCESDCRLGIELSMGTNDHETGLGFHDGRIVPWRGDIWRTSPRCENSSVGDELDISVVCDPLGDATWLRIVRGNDLFCPDGQTRIRVVSRETRSAAPSIVRTGIVA